jgi:hypothetical protein
MYGQNQHMDSTKMYRAETTGAISAAMEPQRARGSVSNRMESLRQSIGALEDAICRLNDKLQPALLPQLAEKQACNESPPQPVCSDLSSEIGALTAAVTYQTLRLNDLNVRCEL